MTMPTIKSCDATACAYNNDKKCHAIAITVGDTLVPHCDTFCPPVVAKRSEMSNAGVGACKVAGCAFNKDLVCSAASISIGHKNDEVLCLTYQKR